MGSFIHKAFCFLIAVVIVGGLLEFGLTVTTGAGISEQRYFWQTK